jgi:hypothetical protein
MTIQRTAAATSDSSSTSNSTNNTPHTRAWRVGGGVAADVRQRLLPHYRDDWLEGLAWGSK